MYRRLVVSLAGLMTSLALLASSPPPAEASTRECPLETGYVCLMTCPSQAAQIGACNSFFGHFGCYAYAASCSSDYNLGCEMGPCCSASTPQYCEGSYPYCVDKVVTCSLRSS